MDACTIISLLLVGTIGGSSITGASPPIFCAENRCENNGKCITVSHPDAGVPTFCTSEMCYKTVLKPTNWTDSLVKCAEMDGNLVGFNSEGDQDQLYKHFIDNFITEFIPAEGTLQFWTRGNNLAPGNPWLWAATNEPVSEHNELPPEQTKNSASQNCLAFTISGDSAQLQPQICSLDKPFICEIPEPYLTEGVKKPFGPVSERAFQCLCPAGYEGYLCEVEQMCGENGCPKREKCFDHVGEPSYVCECNQIPGSMGYNCYRPMNTAAVTVANQKTCYGSNCTTGEYTSPNYPSPYNPNIKELYLIYIPGARNINFTVYDFELEMGKDYLSIGQGLVVPDDYDSDPFPIAGNGSFSMVGDMAWMYFITDRSREERGFRLEWSSNPEPPPPRVSDSHVATNLSCHEDPYIFVQYAAYGQLGSCFDKTSLYKTAKRCNGLNSCNLQIDNDFPSDPCPGVNKSLDVRYQCVEDYSKHTYGRVNVTHDTSNIDTCEERGDSRIHGKSIKEGNFDIRNCPPGMDGVAFEQCSSSGQWTDEPNESLCKSQWINDVLNQIDQGTTPAIEIAKEVNNADTEAVMLDDEGAARDLVQTFNLLDRLVELQSTQLDNTTVDEKQDVVSSFTKEFLQIGSNLLDLSKKDTWKKVQNEGGSPTSVTEELENSAFLLASHLSDADNSTILQSENIVMRVDVVPVSSENVTFVLKDFTAKEENKISLPISAFEATKENKVQMVFFLYKTLGDIFDVVDENIMLTEPDPTEAMSTVSMEPPTTTEGENVIVNSRVISASVNKDTQASETEQDLGDSEVVFTLQHVDKQLKGNITCVFWKYKNTSLHGLSKAGHWSSDGCRLIDTSDSNSTCACTHLTNFAILMDVQGTKISVSHELALRWITIIGCSVSIICLALCVFAFTFFKSLHCIRTTIHRNLCISLLVAELVFLIGVDKTQNKIVCAVIAGILHYSFLAAFFWMFLEALQFYIMLVLVFSRESKPLPYYATGYGLPLVIVGVTAGIRYDGYGTEKYCWLSTKGNLVWSFAGPIAVIIAANLTLLFVSLYKAYSARARVQKDATSTKNLVPWIKGALTMLFLLGCTWGVGLFFLSHESLFMAYLFTILNSLQGLFIFVFYCLGNERVLLEIQKLIARQMWLPLWFRERYGPPQKTLTTTSHADVKKKRAIPSMTVSNEGIDNPAMMQEDTHNSWLYSETGSKTIESEMNYESPYPEPDYD